MTKPENLDAFLNRVVEFPAFVRIENLEKRGALQVDDVAKFKAAAFEYKRAVLAGYCDLDPRVRQELLKSLISDYRNELDRLIRAAETRAELSHHNSGRFQEKAARNLSPASSGEGKIQSIDGASMQPQGCPPTQSPADANAINTPLPEVVGQAQADPQINTSRFIAPLRRMASVFKRRHSDP